MLMRDSPPPRCCPTPATPAVSVLVIVGVFVALVAPLLVPPLPLPPTSGVDLGGFFPTAARAPPPRGAVAFGGGARRGVSLPSSPISPGRRVANSSSQADHGAVCGNEFVQKVCQAEFWLCHVLSASNKR